MSFIQRDNIPPFKKNLPAIGVTGYFIVEFFSLKSIF